MKKLLVFLSIFAVLFVSTIRPLHAEQSTEPFVLTNGNSYYLVVRFDVISSIPIDDYLTLALSVGGANELYLYNHQSGLQLGYDNDVQLISFFDSYVLDNVNYNVYEFVYSLPTTVSLNYDDVNFWFDTENPIPPISIYDTIYSLVNKYVFGNNIESGSHQDLTATILSTTICVLVFALPFLIIWKVIKIIMG